MAVKRVVEVTCDNLLAMFKDYMGDAIPQQAMPHRLEFNPTTRQMALVVTGNFMEGDRSLVVDFEIKRFSPVSNGTGE